MKLSYRIIGCMFNFVKFHEQPTLVTEFFLDNLILQCIVFVLINLKYIKCYNFVESHIYIHIISCEIVFPGHLTFN